MKGELPISRIVALVLAAAVIFIVAYLVFNQSGLMQNILLKKYCDAQCFAYENTAEPGEWSEYAPKCTAVKSTCP